MTSRYDEVMKTKKFLPFHLSHLTNDMVQKAEKELNETEEKRGPALTKLREKIFGEKSLQCPTSDAYLLQFLRTKKFDVNRAFSRLQNFYRTKKSYADVFNTRDYEAVRGLYKAGAAFCLPYRDPDGCAVMVIRIEKWNPDEFDGLTAVHVMSILILYLIEDPATQVCGLRLVVDAKDANFSHLRSLKPRYITLLSKFLSNGLPCRLKGIHICNESTIFQCIWSIMRIFLSEKLNKRVHFHGESEKSLYKYIPKAILTEEFGGDVSNFEASEQFRNDVESFYETFDVICDGGYMS